ncbi:uncharacterized protein BJ171DRAFT_425735 [Polychytrium aggregatum]|uniref:uncharacterized protein n=1 Tax=Polychytrium aggregatum TaxID=110093 RepID=UPI0022FE354F|nr:uncharacterized protein BJ171DRAFT_425735 [Polychytrium aggregatum]KAI9203153.1 hypothetical protein BJ171DRAFT_425735 [Polychytrium aggregatum]
MLEVESGLVQQKEEFAMKMESLAQRREELARKENQLKESLMKFDKFLKENDAKRTRALKKSLDERKTKEQKETEILNLKDNFSNLSNKKDRQAHIIEAFMPFQSYLESVLENTDDFGEVKDILARFDTLCATNGELIDRAREAQERTERDRLQFSLSTEEKNNLILNYNNEIAKLQTRLEESQLKSAKWQAEYDSTLNSVSQKTLLVGQIKMAASNLFQLVKTHLNNRVNTSVDTLNQLDKIQQFMLDLNQITSEIQSPTDKEKPVPASKPAS